MKVVAVLGSSNKKGASSSIAKEILRGAKDAGHEVVVYNIDDMNVRGCRGCEYCKKNWADCVIKDDLKPYWADLHDCGALILSSPNYCSQVAGPMITFMNRHYCLMMIKDGEGMPRVHKGIKLLGVFSQGWDKADAYIDDYKWYLKDFEARGMELQDIIVHTGSMPYDEGSDIMKRAYNAGLSL